MFGLVSRSQETIFFVYFSRKFFLAQKQELIRLNDQLQWSIYLSGGSFYFFSIFSRYLNKKSSKIKIGRNGLSVESAPFTKCCT